MNATVDRVLQNQQARDSRRMNADPLLDGSVEYVEYNGAMVTREEAEREMQRAKAQQLQVFATTLRKRRDDWVSYRQGSNIDQRWTEDLDMYNNRDPATAQPSMMDAVANGGPVARVGDTKATRSTVFIGLTRNKTNAGESRLADILLPTDDKNWGIKPTPQPHLIAKLRDETPLSPTGMQPVPTMPQQPAGQIANAMPGGPQQPAPMGPGVPNNAAQYQPMAGEMPPPQRVKDLAAQIMRRAKEASEGMTEEIDDQLNECDYNGELRKLIHWAALLGTGIVKGPLAANRFRKAWVTDANGVRVLQNMKELKPISVSVDPRNCYPDPQAGEDIHKGAGMFECGEITEREIRALAQQDGYIQEALRDVLTAGPKPRVQSTVTDIRSREYTAIPLPNGYQRWEYWGEVSADDLRACGAIPDDTEDDVLKGYSACVVMINEQVVKAYLNPLETQELPYDFFQWEQVADSPWGLGIPRLMNSQQRVLNAAWRMMMDNAAMSAGPQIVVDQAVIEPYDQRWEITGRKLWRVKVGVSDIKQAMAVFNIDTHQEQFANIIAMAKELADEDTGVPQITQGEKGTSTPDTLGGMQMLMNAANVVLRRLVKRFDDRITRPHIRRYYDYNMEHNENDAIKGDFSVDARGSSALLVRDIQNQALMQLLQAYQQSPTLQAMVKLKELFKKALQAQHIDTEAILYPDEEIDQRLAAMEQNQPAPPQIEVAKIRAASMDAATVSKEQVYLNEMKMQNERERDNQDYRIRELELKERLALLDYANKNELKLADVKAQLADTAIRERSKKELFVAESALKMSPDNPTHEGV